MPSIIRNSAVDECLRSILMRDGFELNPPLSYGQTGVDILASKGGEDWHIECIGFKSSAPARAKDFFESFFRAISRLNDGAVHCVIALPRRFEVGLPARAAHYGVAWRRLADTFPELEIWLVDVVGDNLERTRWGEWLERGAPGGSANEETVRQLREALDDFADDDSTEGVSP